MSSFSHVVVTCSNESCAGVYMTLLKDAASRRGGSLSFMRSVPIYCVPDPQGARIGSGGGTLNAIDHLLQIIGSEQLAIARVLIVHSGGDSQRSPLHSVCGKAFAAINCHLGANDEGNAPFATSIALLINELNSTFRHLPEGAITIASSDVMLSLTSSLAAVPEIPNNGCSVVVVPEDINVAKNHGVVIEDSVNSISATGGCNTSIAKMYLQKPTVSMMIDEGACLPWGGEGQRVLIDTGVVIFTGSCSAALVSLLDDPWVRLCTKRAIDSDPSGSALRLELYSDLLQAFASARGAVGTAAYFKSLGEELRLGDGSDKSRALESIHRRLGQFSIYSVSFYEGFFGHLGTTEELLRFVNICNKDSSCSDSSSEDEKFRKFASKYSLLPNVSSLTPDPSLAGNIAINSIIPVGGVLVLSGSLIEHSLLACCGERVEVGEGCVLSHVSSPLSASVGSGLMLQQVPIISTTPRSGSRYAVILLGVRDNIKASYTASDATVCGGSWRRLFSLGGVGPDDIWEPSLPEGARTLWTARLFALRGADDPIGLTSLWLQHCTADGDDQTVVGSEGFREAVYSWRCASRVSLSDIIKIGDAMNMNTWREYLRAITDNSSAGVLSVESTNAYLKCFRLLLKKVQQQQAISVPTALALWLLHLCSGRTGLPEPLQLHVIQQDGGYDGPSALHAFSVILKRCRDSGPVASKAAFALLLHLAGSAAAIQASQLVLLIAANAGLADSSLVIPAEMHPRLIILVGHVLKDSGLRLEDSALLPSFSLGLGTGTEAVRDMSPVQVRGLLDNAGKRAMAAVSAAISASIGGAEIGPRAAIEAVAQRLVSVHTKCSLDTVVRRPRPCPRSSTDNRVAVARAPVRIDLCGGWSDTPPITYETTGAVLNCAVRIDGRWPISSISRVTEDPVVLLHALRVDSTDKCRLVGEAERCTTFASFADASDPTGPCSLLKACLLALDIVPQHLLESSDATAFSSHLQTTCGGGLEIACLSDLPAGSGMGGSSILAAAVLQSLSELLLLQLTAADLVYIVSQVEQIMTTGGGWQDQVGAIYGGFKVGSSGGPLWNMHADLRLLVSRLDVLMDAEQLGGGSSESSSSSSSGRLPLRIDVIPYSVSPSFARRFEERTFLIFTGTQRLARDTLIRVLRTNAVTPCEEPLSEGSRSTVSRLVRGVEAAARDLLAAAEEGVEDDVIDALAERVGEYWQLKKEMGGAQCEPKHVGLLMEVLLQGWGGAGGCAAAVSLCGAGAGGYAVCILKRGSGQGDLQKAVDHYHSAIDAGNGATITTAVSLHSCAVDMRGVHSYLVSRSSPSPHPGSSTTTTTTTMPGSSIADEYSYLAQCKP